ncbi:MAG TPA: hypothetical protein VFK06_22260 [Candidatus Angelobacter sp.]|nr:hypothetical protein [Candidatus Angelobacter sp.]
MNRIAVWISCIVCSGVMASQPSSSFDANDIAKKLTQGDRSAIYKAGETGDKQFVPVLRKVLQRYERTETPAPIDDPDHYFRNRSLSTESISGATRLALAKLGDKSEQRAIFCELFSRNLETAGYAMHVKLPYVGGWFQINSLASILAETAPPSPIGGGDEVYPVGMQVNQRLRLLFPDGPQVKRPEGLLFGGLLTFTEDAANWLAWIETHKKELSKLKPDGDYSLRDCPEEPVLHGVVTDNRGSFLYTQIDVVWNTAAASPADHGGFRFILFPRADGRFYQAIPPGPYRICTQEVGYFEECREMRIKSGEDVELNLSLTMDNEYNRAALQFLYDMKRNKLPPDTKRVKDAFRAVSHDSSYARDLIGLLDLESGELGERIDQYPAIGALSVIDTPAVSYLVNIIRENEDELIRTNAAHALALIRYHCRQDIAVLLETEASRQDISGEQQTRLRVAKAYVVSAYPPCEAAVVDQE